MSEFAFAHIWQKTKRVSLIRQSDGGEGPFAALAMVANFYGHEIDVVSLRRQYPQIGGRGVSVKNMVDIAADLQFLSQPLKINAKNVHSLAKPAIVQTNVSRYVVLSAIERGRYIIYDSARGISALTEMEFFTMVNGVAIEMSPQTTFESKVDKNPLKLMTIVRQVQGLGSDIAFLMILCLVTFVLSMVIPFYSIMIMDEAVAALDERLLISIFFAGFFVVTVKAVIEFLRDRLIAYMGGVFMTQVSRKLVGHLIRLPMSFYETRHAGDILQRLEAMENVKNTVTQHFAIAVIDSIILASTFVLLFFYSKALTIIVMGGALLMFLYRMVIYQKYESSQAEMFAAESEEKSNLMETIRGMQSIKLYSIEGTRLDLWGKIFSKKLGSYIGIQKSTIGYLGIDRTISTLENVLIIFVGAKLVMAGDITVGVLVSFLSFKDQFLSKFIVLLEQITNFRLLKVHLDRLSDIVNQEAEPEAKTSDQLELYGRLEIKGLNFRYTPNDALLFVDLDLYLQPGDSIAIIGPSGCGKSTLMKIMLGLIEPTSGEILVDDYSIRKIRSSYRRSVATVMQNDCILSGTIMDNITFFDKTPDEGLMIQSAMAACIHEDISRMAMGYQSLISDYNNTISGGQKQRILIARALYRRPRIIFMDEATSALDVTNEELVNEGIRRMGITRVIVAHRPATIYSADMIYKLERGKLVLQDRETLDLAM